MTKFPKNAKSTILNPFCTLFEKSLFFFFFQFELSITVSNFNKKILADSKQYWFQMDARTSKHEFEGLFELKPWVQKGKIVMKENNGYSNFDRSCHWN